MTSPYLFATSVIDGDADSHIDRGRVTLAVSGEFDVAAVDAFTDAADRALAGRPTSLVIELGGASLIDSSAIGAILRVRRAAESASIEVRVVAPQPYQIKLFRITGLSHVIEPGSAE